MWWYGYEPTSDAYQPSSCISTLFVDCYWTRIAVNKKGRKSPNRKGQGTLSDMERQRLPVQETTRRETFRCQGIPQYPKSKASTTTGNLITPCTNKDTDGADHVLGLFKPHVRKCIMRLRIRLHFNETVRGPRIPTELVRLGVAQVPCKELYLVFTDSTLV